jgi:cell division protein FtsI (penicillin-binding protein 3)
MKPLGPGRDDESYWSEIMKKTPRKTLTAPIRRVRFVWVAIFFCLWVGAIACRLVWLQVGRHAEFADKAQKQQQRTFEVAPRRGVLYDRNLHELAMTVLVDSVYAVPSELGDNRQSDAQLLAKIVHTDPTDKFTSESQIEARLDGQRNFAWIARKLDADTAQRVRELNLKGIYFQKEFKRFYPNGDLLAHVLGYVGTDDDGLGGMERKFDGPLHGQPGHVLTAIDAKRHVLGSEERQPEPGQNLVLTIDSNIQYMAERALDAQMEKVKAKHGTVVVQDPHTGQILALAVSPRFNPNDKRHMDADVLTNLAVSDVYEPGSTFKLVAYSAAIDAAGVEPTDIVDCQGGAMTMYGRTLHDDKSDGKLGRVTVQYALERSSDVGAAKMALKLGNERFYDYIKAFGFGTRTGVELPSETRGLLQTPRKWGATSFMSIAIGQEVAVTPVQLVTMVSTIANGGVYMPPHILLEKTDVLKGDLRLQAAPFRPVYQLPAQLPQDAHRVIKELTAAKMRSMMQGIVTEGTGKAAQLNGYSSAGKTGTANKIDPKTKTYSHTQLVASFAGFAPVSAPAISVTVVIDTPTVGSLYGAAVSAPVFRDVAQQVLEYLGVPHDQAVKSPQQVLMAQKDVESDEVPNEAAGDLNALFDQVNSLPADDPLRQPANAAAMAANVQADAANDAARESQPRRSGLIGLPEKVLAVFHANGDTTSVMPAANVNEAKTVAPAPSSAVQAKSSGGVVVDGGKRVAVPQFAGAALRNVVEMAGGAGLRVQTVGSGLARDQAPAAGTMVPVGTEVVVRFAR